MADVDHCDRDHEARATPPAPSEGQPTECCLRRFHLADDRPRVHEGRSRRSHNLFSHPALRELKLLLGKALDSWYLVETLVKAHDAFDLVRFHYGNVQSVSR